MEEKNNSEIVESKNNKIFTWQLPKKNTQFFGRKEKIEAIKKQLADAEIKIAVIAGLGGVGKTQLSLAYIYNSKKDYGAILWFGAETENDLSLQFTALAQNEEEGFGWNVEGLSKKILTKKIYTYLLSQFKTILIVFDNVPSEKRNYIAQYLPDYKDINLDYSNIHILMTYRDQMTWNESWGFIKPISVDVFSPEESCQYIQYHLEKENKKDALKLAEILGYHPLALSQAVAYIKDESSVKKYIEIYINNEEKKKKFLNHSGFKKDNYLKTIYITWDMSMYALSSQKHALEFMRYLIFY